ncbi:ion transporter [Trichocoleus sp. FACHB-90]|uniref:potassium channel family protein n=1 Tax=Cyanophyceae TaxID=3028117 RepID=UPI001689BFE8|nr:potassium channel family protein [Trichocoleus sp. FACHB-90]MBD1925508.1 ion transporter [Trichocoleus sp. FACHB-90]
MNNLNTSEKRELQKERLEVLEQLEDWLETPMLFLGFGWLLLLVVELIWGLNPLLEVISNTIWIVFILDFVLRFTLADRKLVYIKHNWLTALSLVLPALRVFRISRVIRILKASRGLRLVRVISSLNRGMRSLRASMSRRGFGYVMVLTLVVTLVGAAGIYAFESNLPSGGGLNNYGEALWWTAMLMTTMGGEYVPQTPEGRVLHLILALYAFTVFGYVTATLATFFIGRDAENEEAELASAKSIAALHQEIAALRADIQALSSQKPEP